MFEETKFLEIMEQGFRKKFQSMREEALLVLESPGYSHLIKKVEISEDFNEFKIQMNDDIDIKDQDVLQLFCFGGQVKKGDTLINVLPSERLRKAVGKR